MDFAMSAAGVTCRPATMVEQDRAVADYFRRALTLSRHVIPLG